MKTITAAASIAALFAAVPAFAIPAKPVETAEAPRAAPTTAAKQQRYCLVDDVTGSRIPVRTCKTLDGWRQAGIEFPVDRAR